jgi:large repetitive protein
LRSWTCTGVISGTITVGAAAYGPYTTTVTASDGTDFSSATFTWTVTSYVTLTDPGNQTSIAGNSVSLTLAASDAGADTFTYAVVNLPAGLSLNTSTGVISGDASIGAIAQSPYLTTVTATDGDYSSSQTFWWTVNSPVTINTPNGTQHNDTGDNVLLQISATDSTSAALTYSETGLPLGLTLNTTTGVISGTIIAGGVYQTTITASDDTYSTSQSLRWIVASDGPLVLSDPGNQWDLTGDFVSIPLVATDANSSATINYSATGLPSGLSLNAATGLISGDLSAGDFSSTPYSVVVTASDGTYSNSEEFNWSGHPPARSRCLLSPALEMLSR